MNQIAQGGYEVNKKNKPLRLYWKDQLIGYVTEATFSDFPWVSGKVKLSSVSPDLREALEYIHRESRSEEGLHDWPFPDEFFDHWRIVQPDGTWKEISPPIIDFVNGDIDWR